MEAFRRLNYSAMEAGGLGNPDAWEQINLAAGETLFSPFAYAFKAINGDATFSAMEEMGKSVGLLLETKVIM